MFMSMLRMLFALLSSTLSAETVLLQPHSRVHITQYPTSLDATNVEKTYHSSDGSLWKTGERGVFRDERLFHSKRFLPCDQVTGFSEPSKGRVRVHTTCGDSEFWFEPFRLGDKAKYFEKIALRHDRHGYVADSRGGKTVSDDNDGLWTAMYAAAKLFEYKATGDKTALQRAERAIRAVLFLEKITGEPGYPARSYIVPGEQKPKDGFWYWTADRKYEFKSDTSSDESVGHFFLFSVAWDLLPDGPLRADVRATCRRQMDYILKHNYTLIDPKTGKPTRWGRWNPEYFSGEGKEDAPLNALELMSFLRTSAHVTGDKKYERELDKVILEMGYLKIAGRLKEQRLELNYSDEELAMLSFYPLLQYEKYPERRKAILGALDDWFQNMRREKNPLWNVIYELGRGENLQLRRDSIWTLERLPMDLRNWRVENSWRKDLALESGADRFRLKQTSTLLPPDERAAMKWNGNPFVLDAGKDGSGEDDGTVFLLPYWMGRYYKLWVER
jgi:hypothetical protein